MSFVDIETTGLKPGFHEAVDVGMVISSLKGAYHDEFHCRIMPHHPERAGDSIRQINGFTEQRWKELGAFSKADAVQKVQSFFREVTDGKNVLFCAYNESFDYPFLRHLFRDVDEEARELFDYTLDLPSIAWGAGYYQLHGWKLTQALGVDEEPQGDDPDTDPVEHTGLTGAKKNLRIYNALMSSHMNEMDEER